MPFFHLGPAGDSFAGAFGGVAALLLLGGPVLLRWQRNRQHFLLAQTALAQGVTRFPKGPPFWLTSLRQGITTLTLGIALIVIGAVATFLTTNASVPASTATTQAASSTLTSSVASLLTTAPAPPEPFRFGPLQPNAAMEEWHRIQSINSLGLMSLASGFIFTLLGIARVAFAKTERKHESERDPI